ncbi:MAG: DivIVA domain-containing protein [Deltaproteobacteria bacterium]|nr:DivIVA domain-containing protein [Deltaproteobacteria bacterium]
MKLTPLDIQQQKFEVKWRGYDRQEVETFLEMVSEDVESLLKDCNKLRDELKKCESQMADFRENERAIQQTIMATQKVSDDLKRNAQRESDLILSEAKVAAEKITNDARTHAEKIMGGSRLEIEKLRKEFNDLKNKKMECELALKSMLESHLRRLKTETERKE